MAKPRDRKPSISGRTALIPSRRQPSFSPGRLLITMLQLLALMAAIVALRSQPLNWRLPWSGPPATQQNGRL